MVQEEKNLLLSNIYKQCYIFVFVIKLKMEREKTKKEWLDDLLYREDTLYSNRVNFFILAQSMLFLSYATVVSFPYLGYMGKSVGCLISIFAMSICWYFYFIFRSTVRYIMYLRANLKRIDSIYRRIWKKRKFIGKDKNGNELNYEIPGSNYSLGPGLSICFFVVWVFLGIFLITFDLLWIVTISGILFIIITLILYFDTKFVQKYKSADINRDEDRTNDNVFSARQLVVIYIIFFIIIFIILIIRLQDL